MLATTSFDSTWRAPDAQPVGSFAGKKIIGFVMSKNEASRRAAEDALARELTARGAQGVPGYTVFNVYAGMNLSDRTRVRVGIENIGDKKYRAAHSRMDAPGVSLFASLEVTF